MDLKNAPSLEDAEIQLAFARRLQETKDLIKTLNHFAKMELPPEPGKTDLFNDDDEDEPWNP